MTTIRSCYDCPMFDFECESCKLDFSSGIDGNVDLSRRRSPECKAQTLIADGKMYVWGDYLSME